MADVLTPSAPPCTLADCLDGSPNWIERVRMAVKRDGQAVRGIGLTVQAKCLTTNRWHPIMTPRNGTEFVSAADAAEAVRLILLP